MGDVIEFQEHAVRDYRRVMRFRGRVLGESSTRRVGVARWSEVTIYGLEHGGYVLAKRGWSLVVHRPGCDLVTRRMMAWIDLPDDADRRRDRFGCPTCQPDLVDLDPQTMVEETRYTAAVARTPAELDEVLHQVPPDVRRPPRLPLFLRQAVEQVIPRDPVFAAYWVQAHQRNVAAR